MSLDRIYASKLYRTHPNKDRIHGAINDPLNSELILQLQEYLEPEDDEDASSESAKPSVDPDEVVTEVEEPTAEKPSAESVPDPDRDEVQDPDRDEEVDDTKPSVNPADVQVELNSCVDTRGVSAVSIKGSEIWIRYNDDTNLNAVMESVIAKMQSISGMQFSRLARTYNSIVFDHLV